MLSVLKISKNADDYDPGLQWWGQMWEDVSVEWLGCRVCRQLCAVQLDLERYLSSPSTRLQRPGRCDLNPCLILSPRDCCVKSFRTPVCSHLHSISDCVWGGNTAVMSFSFHILYKSLQEKIHHRSVCWNLVFLWLRSLQKGTNRRTVFYSVFSIAVQM